MHPVRLEILELLGYGEECVCHMEAVLGYKQAYISQQLAVLRKAGLVQDRREGWNIFYFVARPDVFVLLDQARGLVGGQPQVLNVPQRKAECPCPKCAVVDVVLS